MTTTRTPSKNAAWIDAGTTWIVDDSDLNRRYMDPWNRPIPDMTKAKVIRQSGDIAAWEWEITDPDGNPTKIKICND
jgi:hypothetical protein